MNIVDFKSVKCVYPKQPEPRLVSIEIFPKVN